MTRQTELPVIMKKWLLVLLALIALAIASIYIFIPSTIQVTSGTHVSCNANGASRLLLSPSNWRKWWPETDTTAGETDTSHVFKHDNTVYTVSQKVYNGVNIAIRNERISCNSKLSFLPVSLDTSVISWAWSIPASNNPVTRLRQYADAVDIKKEMQVILTNMDHYLSNRDHIYGMHIEKISTTDTFLVALKSTHNVYPTTKDVYTLINTLKKYIAAQGAEITNAPIMNVTQRESALYELMVAVPTNKALQPSGDILYRRMVPGNFMSAEIKGGDATVKEAMWQMHLFMTDYERTVMAIPYAKLVTDRSMEPDTSKWVTRIYQPSF